MGINLKLLSVFALVADHRSFRQAAEKLGRSQSAVSTQIRQLEEQLGVPLFHRTTRHVALSPEGQQLLTFVHEALNQIQNGVDAMVNAAEQHRHSVNIACSPTIAPTRLAPILSAFKADFPHVVVHVRELSSSEMLDCLQAEEIEFGIGPRVNRDAAFSFQSVIEDELCVVVPPEAAGGLHTKILPSDLDKFPMITPSKSSVVRSDVGHNPSELCASLESQYESIQVQTLLSLVEAGLGGVIVPRIAITATGGGFRVLSFKPPIMREICIISLPGKTLSPLATQLASTSTRVLRSTASAEGMKHSTPSASRRHPAEVSALSWEAQWSTLLAGARKEGRISILSTIASGFRNWAKAAQDALPGIAIDLHQLPNSEEGASRMLAERQAGGYNYDLLIMSAVTALPRLKTARALDPLRPLLFRPDVLDERVWKNGFEVWADDEKKYGFPLSESIMMTPINIDLVREGELQSARSLLDPRWRGKIILGDLRSGSERVMLTSIRLRDGDEAVQRLIVDQKPAFVQDMRKAAEGLVRGHFAIAPGLGPQTLQEYVDAGIAGSVKFVDIPDVAFIAYTLTLWAANRPPNPNAAKLFANWMLTKEGQQLLSTHLAHNVRRTDVPLFDPNAVARPGQHYFRSNNKKVFAELKKTRALLKRIGSVSA